MYHSFITQMSMYMSPKVHIYPKVTRSTCLQNYPKLSKPHVHVSKTIQAACTSKWNVKVLVSKITCLQKYMYPKLSKTIQDMCTCIEMCISHKTHKNSSFLLFFLEGDPVGSTIGPVCISRSCKLNINC